MNPNVELGNELCGFENHGWLNRIIASARKFSLTRSLTVNVRAMLALIQDIPGPNILYLPTLPAVPTGTLGTVAKADVSNHKLPVLMPCRTSTLSLTWFAVWFVFGVLRLPQLQLTVNGLPVRRVMMPAVCHPPRIFELMPLFAKRALLPNGRRHTRLWTYWSVRSKSDFA